MSIRSEMPLEYYDWLTDIVDLGSHRNYTKLLSHLFDTEFYWVIPNDANRAEDGKKMRFEYLIDCDFYDDSWVDMPCSVLEMLIGLARRVRIDIMPDFKMGISDWFWQFLDNLGACKYDDFHYISSEIDQILCDFMSRNGNFMLFLCEKVPKKQQKMTEIWYQMQFWLAENFDF